MNFEKKYGSMMKLLPVLLAMAAMAAVTALYVTYMSDYDKREYADQIAREYILKMETQGYLSEAMKNNLISDLSNVGFDNINLQGTTMTKAEYGDEIVLMINAHLETEDYVFENLLSKRTDRKIRQIKISKKSTSKC